MPEVRKVSNIPNEGVCPWKKDVYNVNGYKVRIL